MHYPSDFTVTVTMVINRAYGGFVLSEAAVRELARRKGATLIESEFGPVLPSYERLEATLPRNDGDLVSVVLSMGKEANGGSADLRVVNVPIKVEIEGDDGREQVNVYAEGF